MYIALGWVFLAVSAVLIGFIIYTVARSARREKVFISKKNLVYLVPSFALIYALYLTAAAFAGEKLDFFYCLQLIDDTLDLFVFKPRTGLISPLVNAYPVFYADFVIAALLGSGTAVLSICSFFSRRIRNAFVKVSLMRKGCDIVLGDSESAVSYAGHNKNCVMLCGNITGQRYAELLKDGFAVMRTPLDSASLARKLCRKRHHIIAFKDADISYTSLIAAFTKWRKTDGSKAYLHLEAEQDEMKLIREKFISSADGSAVPFILSFSKYEIIARNFVSDHPISKYIPRDFFNGNFTLKNDKKINVVFVGFGKVNYQLFRMCAMQFQFAGEKDGKLCSAPVNYYIYDNDEKRMHNEFFSRIMFEFDEDFKNCDFPPPEKICEVVRDCKDINSVEVRQKFKALVNDDSYTYFVVSLENDLQDAAYARTLIRILSGNDNYRIFVRAKNDKNEELNCCSDSIIYFGEEKEIYTEKGIVNNAVIDTAKRINLLYNNLKQTPKWLREIKDLPLRERFFELNERLKEADNRDRMETAWSELQAIEQSSNIYHALNMPFKLGLMGFDTVKLSECDRGVTRDEFDSRYENRMKQTDYCDYDFFFEKNACNVLAYIEHSRWNALYILYDYTQMRKADMKIVESRDDDGEIVKNIPHKDAQKRQHACITTYYGLNDLVKFKYEKLLPDKKFSKADRKSDSLLHELGRIYAYDYMDLDRLYEELNSTGFAIVDRRA